MTFTGEEQNIEVDLNYNKQTFSYTLSITKEEKYAKNSGLFGNLVL